MFKYSFYDSKKYGTTKADAVEFVKHTNKPLKYTYGLKYRRPTTYEVPVSLEEEIDKIENHSLVDVDEREDYVDINAYSDNDMW